MADEQVQALPSHDGGEDDVTRLLAKPGGVRDVEFRRLIALVYDDLRRIAHRRLQMERAGHTLNTTAVVHEAYLRLSSGTEAAFQDRAHFFAVASRVIRNVLIDYGRSRRARKRGGSAIMIPLREDVAEGPSPTIELLALDEALSALGAHDPLLEQLVECRFFGGMSMQDTADALGLSLRTAERHWTRARAWLHTALHPAHDDA